MTKQEAYRLRLQAKGLCVHCREPRDGKSKWSCKACMEKDRQRYIPVKLIKVKENTLRVLSKLMENKTLTRQELKEFRV